MANPAATNTTPMTEPAMDLGAAPVKVDCVADGDEGGELGPVGMVTLPGPDGPPVAAPVFDGYTAGPVAPPTTAVLVQEQDVS
jgi:hypothetical protein